MSVSIAMETLLYSAAPWKCSKVREGGERWEERRGERDAGRSGRVTKRKAKQQR